MRLLAAVLASFAVLRCALTLPCLSAIAVVFTGYCLLLLRRNVFLFWDSSRAGTQHEERPEQVYDEVVEAPGFRRVPRAMLVREERGTYRMRPIVGGSYVRPQF